MWHRQSCREPWPAGLGGRVRRQLSFESVSYVQSRPHIAGPLPRLVLGAHLFSAVVGGPPGAGCGRRHPRSGAKDTRCAALVLRAPRANADQPSTQRHHSFAPRPRGAAWRAAQAGPAGGRASTCQPRPRIACSRCMVLPRLRLRWSCAWPMHTRSCSGTLSSSGSRCSRRPFSTTTRRLPMTRGSRCAHWYARLPSSGRQLDTP